MYTYIPCYPHGIPKPWKPAVITFMIHLQQGIYTAMILIRYRCLSKDGRCHEMAMQYHICIYKMYTYIYIYMYIIYIIYIYIYIYIIYIYIYYIYTYIIYYIYIILYIISYLYRTSSSIKFGHTQVSDNPSVCLMMFRHTQLDERT